MGVYYTAYAMIGISIPVENYLKQYIKQTKELHSCRNGTPNPNSGDFCSLCGNKMWIIREYRDFSLYEDLVNPLYEALGENYIAVPNWDGSVLYVGYGCSTEEVQRIDLPPSNDTISSVIKEALNEIDPALWLLGEKSFGFMCMNIGS